MEEKPFLSILTFTKIMIRRNHNMGDLEDLIMVSPIFMLMGIVFIAGYLAPYMMGKIDDGNKTDIAKIQTICTF